MHVKAIGRVVDGSPEEGIDDQLVKNWPSQNGAKAYGPLHTKWLAQDPSGNYREVVENADNYACKASSSTTSQLEDNPD
jgi:hypothetical protein